MATQLGRASAQSAGERRTNEKDKNRFKKTGHLLRGWFEASVTAHCKDFIITLCFRSFIFYTNTCIYLQAAERRRGSLCKSTSEAPITGHYNTL